MQYLGSDGFEGGALCNIEVATLLRTVRCVERRRVPEEQAQQGHWRQDIAQHGPVFVSSFEPGPRLRDGPLAAVALNSLC